MSTTPTDYCAACGDERQFRHEQRILDFEVRGELLKLDVPVKVCA